MRCVASELSPVASRVFTGLAAPGLDVVLAHVPNNVNDFYGRVVAVIAHLTDAGNEFVFLSLRPYETLLVHQETQPVGGRLNE